MSSRARVQKHKYLFKQWKILFGEVCGYDVSSTSKKITKLAEAYEVRYKNIEIGGADFLCPHIFCLLYENTGRSSCISFPQVAITLRGGSRQPRIQKLILKSVLELEEGGVFRHLNISNFPRGRSF